MLLMYAEYCYLSSFILALYFLSFILAEFCVISRLVFFVLFICWDIAALNTALVILLCLIYEIACQYICFVLFYIFFLLVVFLQFVIFVLKNWNYCQITSNNISLCLLCLYELDCHTFDSILIRYCFVFCIFWLCIC